MGRERGVRAPCTCRRSRSATGSSSRRTPAAHVEIVGIVANVLKDGNDRKPQPESTSRQDSGRVRRPLRARDQNSRGPAGVSRAGGARGRAGGAAPTAAVETVPLSQRVAESVDQPRFATTVLDVRGPRARAGVGRLYGVLCCTACRSVGASSASAPRSARRAADLVALVFAKGSVRRDRAGARARWPRRRSPG